MIATGNSFAADSKASINSIAYNESQAEKKFVKAFNTFKQLSANYPTPEEALEKIRELEENDDIIISFLLGHPRLLREEVRTEVLRALGATKRQIESANRKESGKRHGAKITEPNSMTSPRHTSEENIMKVIEPSNALGESSSKSEAEAVNDIEPPVLALENEERPAFLANEGSDNASEISMPSAFELSDNEEDLNNEEENRRQEWMLPASLNSRAVNKSFKPTLIKKSEEENNEKNAPKKKKRSSAEIDLSNVIEGARNRIRNNANERIEDIALEQEHSTRNKKAYAHKSTQTEAKYPKENEELMGPQSATSDSHHNDLTGNSQGVDSNSEKPDQNKKSKAKLTKLEREMKKLGL